jgi:ATP-binding cassette subfamily C (CFTR/MRP) protein 1
MPLNFFCQGLPQFAQAVACFARIEAYCLKKPISPDNHSSAASTVDVSDGSVALRRLRSPPNHEEGLVSFEHADISWSQESSELALKDLTLTIRRGLTAIVGPVASGKSTLLQSILRETAVIRGSLTTKLSGVAFCSQTPWIMDDTIQRNITGDTLFDQKWYDFSVSSCGLQGDLERMPRGGQTIAGSNGASLSGGQRQRVVSFSISIQTGLPFAQSNVLPLLIQALARAVYSRLPVVILDDVMSGLDPTAASIVSTRLFGRDGHFRKAGISVILATHNSKRFGALHHGSLAEHI